MCTRRHFTGLALLLCAINLTHGRHLSTQAELVTAVSPQTQEKDNPGQMMKLFSSISTAKPSPLERLGDRVRPVLEQKQTQVSEHTIEDNNRPNDPKCNQLVEGVGTPAPERSSPVPHPVNTHRLEKREIVNDPQNHLGGKAHIGLHINLHIKINNHEQSNYTLCKNNTHDESKDRSRENTTDTINGVTLVPGKGVNRSRNSTGWLRTAEESTTLEESSNQESTTLEESSTLESTTEVGTSTLETTTLEASTTLETSTLESTTLETSTTVETTHTTTELMETSTLESTTPETTTYTTTNPTEEDTDGDIGDYGDPSLSIKNKPRSGKGTGVTKKYTFLPRTGGLSDETLAVIDKGPGNNPGTIENPLGTFTKGTGTGKGVGEPNKHELTPKDGSATTKGHEKIDYATFIPPTVNINQGECPPIFKCINDTLECQEFRNIFLRLKDMICCQR